MSTSTVARGTATTPETTSATTAATTPVQRPVRQPIDRPVILGTGQLGLAIMDEFAARGIPVTLVNRRGVVAESLPSQVTLLQADLTDPAAVRRVCAGADAVFYCAQPAYTEWPAQFPPLVDAAVAGLGGCGIRLIFGDNLYLYGPTGGAPIHEDLPSAATGPKGRTRGQLVETLFAAHKTGALPVTMGRASDFYGPRVTDSVLGDLVFAAALAGKTVNLLGNIDLPHSYTYIRDFARALIVLGEHPAAYGQAWHVPNAPTLTTRQFLDLLQAATGRPVKIRTAGPTMLNVLGLFNPLLREFKELSYEFTAPYIVDDRKFRTVFDLDATPHRQAIAETLAWYRMRTADRAHRS